MGCKVAWDQKNQAIHLTGGGQRKITADKDLPDSTPEELAHYGDQVDNGVTITLRPDISVFLDGSLQQFSNVNGEPVYPVVLEGVTYLPVRNVGELCGLGVAWVPGDKSVNEWDLILLYTPLTEEQKAETLAYETSIQTLFNQLSTAVSEYTSAQNMDTEEALAKLNTMQDAINQMTQKEISVPYLREYFQKSFVFTLKDLNDTYVAYDMTALYRGQSFTDLKNMFSIYNERIYTLKWMVKDLEKAVTALKL